MSLNQIVRGTIKVIFILLLFVGLAACTNMSPTPAPTLPPSGESLPTITQEPTTTFTPEPTIQPTLAPTDTPIPTPTVIYQKLGEIYGGEYNQKPLGIVSALKIGFADSRMTHFDVGIPYDMDIKKNPVISPITGTITELLFQNKDGTCQSEGCALSISPDIPVIGTENLKTKYGVKTPNIIPHLGHLTHLFVKLNDHVIQGQPLGYVMDLSKLPIGWINKIGWIIMVQGPGQYSPCDINPSLSFCGLCYPASLQKGIIDDKSICTN